MTTFFEDQFLEEAQVTPDLAILLRNHMKIMRDNMRRIADQNAIYEDALREIKDTGSRQIWSSYEREDGSYEKRVVKVDMSIEAMTAHDALTKAGANG